jgi:hypothetical protein
MREREPDAFFGSIDQNKHAWFSFLDDDKKNSAVEERLCTTLFVHKLVEPLPQRCKFVFHKSQINLLLGCLARGP